MKYTAIELINEIVKIHQSSTQRSTYDSIKMVEDPAKLAHKEELIDLPTMRTLIQMTAQACLYNNELDDLWQITTKTIEAIERYDGKLSNGAWAEIAHTIKETTEKAIDDKKKEQIREFIKSLEYIKPQELKENTSAVIWEINHKITRNA